jgi:kynurenine formamidase
MAEQLASLRSLRSEALLDEQAIRGIFDSVSNWGRWGPDDELGALNFITPELRRAAAALVRSGECVSLARDFPTIPGPDNPFPAHHHMTIAGDDSCCLGVSGLEVAQDYIGINFHGFASSHIDALCHTFADGRMFNGGSASQVLSTGARRNAIDALRDGIVGRGVLLDMPRALGRPWIEPETMIGVAELEAAEAAGDVTVGSGDILLIRMGREPMEQDERVAAGRARGEPLRLAGLHPSVLPWLHAREIAALGGDGPQDPVLDYLSNPVWPWPIHACGLVAMGLHLLDNLSLERVAEAAARLGRWSFQLCISPLRIVGGTGSPVNPIAIF